MRRIVTSAAALAVLAATGCSSSDDPETPSACLGSANTYLKALEDAPGEVRLAGGTPISDCLIEDQEPGALQTVGKSLVDAATELNQRAREGDDQATVELGYLVGAAQEGAADTGGIHQDLVLRLDSAARFTGSGEEPFSAAFERAYGRGYAAGQASG